MKNRKLNIYWECDRKERISVTWKTIIRLSFHQKLFNNNNNNKLYLHDYNKVLQYCKSYLKLLIDSL